MKRSMVGLGARSKGHRKFNHRVQRPHRYRRPQSEHQRRECCRDWCRFVYNITLVFAHQPPDNTTLYHLGVQVTEQPKSKFIHSCRDKSPAMVKQPVQPSVGYKVHSIARSPETKLLVQPVSVRELLRMFLFGAIELC